MKIISGIVFLFLLFTQVSPATAQVLQTKAVVVNSGDLTGVATNLTATPNNTTANQGDRIAVRWEGCVACARAISYGGGFSNPQMLKAFKGLITYTSMTGRGTSGSFSVYPIKGYVDDNFEASGDTRVVMEYLIPTLPQGTRANTITVLFEDNGLLRVAATAQFGTLYNPEAVTWPVYRTGPQTNGFWSFLVRKLGNVQIFEFALDRNPFENQDFQNALSNGWVLDLKNVTLTLYINSAPQRMPIYMVGRGVNTTNPFNPLIDTASAPVFSEIYRGASRLPNGLAGFVNFGGLTISKFFVDLPSLSALYNKQQPNKESEFVQITIAGGFNTNGTNEKIGSILRLPVRGIK